MSARRHLTFPHKLRGCGALDKPHPATAWPAQTEDNRRPRPRQLHAVVRPQGAGISRSRQIFRAKNSLISRWRGTVDVFPAARLT